MFGFFTEASNTDKALMLVNFALDMTAFIALGTDSAGRVPELLLDAAAHTATIANLGGKFSALGSFFVAGLNIARMGNLGDIFASRGVATKYVIDMGVHATNALVTSIKGVMKLSTASFDDGIKSLVKCS